MPRGIKDPNKAPVDPFKSYRLRESESVRAIQSQTAFEFAGQAFQAGSYMVQDGVAFKAVDKDEFESKYEQVRTRTVKPKTTEGEASEVAEVAEAAPVAEAAAVN